MLRKILLITFVVLAANAYAQNDAKITRETVSQNAIEGHIYFLASDELKGRDTGSPEIDIAAQYLANAFRRYGVKPVPGAEQGYFQPVQLETKKAASYKKLVVGDFETIELALLSGTNIDTTLNLVFVGYGNEGDYKQKEVEGKMMVALAGSEDDQNARAAFSKSRTKYSLAKERGALGLIEVNSFDENTWNRYSSYLGRSSVQAVQEDNSNFLHGWVQDPEGLLMLAAKKKKATATIAISGMEKIPMPAKNVVGMVEGTDPDLKDEFIIYSAHYDHIGIGKPNAEGDSIYNGARDNAVGVVTVLSAAESIAKNPTKRSALFILFTAEEKGLLGSKWYANHPMIPLDQMVYCFNSDNGGYNDTSVATIIGLGRTTAADHIKEACAEFDLGAIDDQAPEQGLFDRSDNVSFAAKGIPAPTFGMGFTSFDAEIRKYYHQAADNPDNLDYEYLTKFFGAYVLSCRLIANDPETPFWVEGDKYYEAGVKLYDK